MIQHKVLFSDNSLKELINFREPVIQSYLNQGWSVIVVCPQNRSLPELGEDFKYIPIDLCRGSMSPFLDLKYFINLYSIYRKERPNYIFHYTIKPNIYGTFAARLLGIESTMMIAGLGYIFTTENLKCKIGRLLYRIAMRLADNVFVLNKDNYDLLLECNMVQSSKLILLNGGEGIDINKYVNY